MPDNLSRAQRSYCMSQVRSRDTQLERVVRSAMHRRGYRFRKHVKALNGSPDLVFTRQRVVVFIDGDFWHGFRFPVWRHKLSPFWQEKIERNRRRDHANFRGLRAIGWFPVRIWQHQIETSIDRVIDRIEAVLRSRRSGTQASSGLALRAAGRSL